METIHTSSLPDTGNYNAPPPNRTARTYLDSFLKILPFVQWILTILIAIAVFGIGFRDSQTIQSQTIRDIQKDHDNLRRSVDERKNEQDKQFTELKNQVVTRELFEERTKQIQDEQTRQRQLIERILENQRTIQNQ